MASCPTTSWWSVRCAAREPTCTSCSTRSAWPRRCRRRGASSAGCGPAAIFTTGGYLALPAGRRRPRARHPEPPVGGERDPGPRDRGRRLAWRRGWRSPSRRPLDAFPGRSFVSGTPIRSFAGIDRDGRPQRRSASAPDDRLLLVFGGSQAVARITAALEAALRAAARRLEGPPPGRARPAWPPRWPCASDCRRACGDRYRADRLPDRSHGRCARGRRPRAGARRLVDLRRGGRGRAWPRSWCRIRTRPATSRRTPPGSPTRARR